MFALLSKARLLGRGGQSLLHNCFTSSITPSYLYTRSIVACIQHVQHVAPISRIVIHRGIRTSSEGLPAPPPLSSLVTSQDMQEARQWIEHFRIASIPKDVVEITFSRSSGPGGQNVNKVNTKATLRCSVDAHWIPLWARDGLCKSSQYTPSSHAILITSTKTRSQTQNIDDCLSKLHGLILSVSSDPVKNEPTDQQKERVRALERAEKTRRRIEKDKRSQTKRSRSSRDWD